MKRLTAEKGGLVHRRGALVGGAAIAVVSHAAAFGAAMGPVSETRFGRIRGLDLGGTKVFLNVPYGAPTGGAARWLPPRPPAPWTGVLDTTAHGAMPPQITPVVDPMEEETAMMQQGPVSEDCLRLNIYTPAVGPNSGKRAVMVWFHGGGYFAGSGNATSYDGTNLAKKQDVVVVSLTHRLNHFGFLYLGELFGAEYADSGNVGLLDCIAALHWVRDNISNFGGDPDRVMLFGQSGGGGKVSTLMGMPAAQGLFHRVAAQSGASLASGTKEQATASAKRLLDAMGINNLAELQAAPWQRFIDTARPIRGAGGTGPVVDGVNLPASAFDPVATPISKSIPLIMSTTETEAASWGAPVDPIDDHALNTLVKGVTNLSDADVGSYIDIYKTNYPGKDNAYIGQLILSQWGFTDRVTTQAERKAAQAAAGGAPVYYFYFAHHTDVRGDRLHAPHTSEIPYIFDSLTSSAPIVGKLTPAKQALADACSAYWANFAKTGNPNGAGLPHWEPYNLQTRPTLVVTGADKPTMINDPMGPTRKAVAEYKRKVLRA